MCERLTLIQWYTLTTTIYAFNLCCYHATLLCYITIAIVLQCAVRVWRSVRIIHRKQQVRLKLQALEHEAVERLRKELASSTIAVAWRACLLRYEVS
jgi:hypothetical protein